MSLRNLSVFFILTVFLFSCDSGKKHQEEQLSDVSKDSAAEILLSPVLDSPEFENAILEMNTPGDYDELTAGEISFAYNVKNYELKAQTKDAEIKNCANSGKGQHIHLILNNEPYTAHYDASFSRDLKDGNYVALSFLSRSYHESIKQPDAYVIRQFKVGDVPEVETDLNGPNLFYSRPKGTYVGNDTKKLLLDFYLINCALSKDGYKVKATINGQEFMIDKWVPYFVEGLPMGENVFQIELLDSNGNLVDSPFNKVVRTIQLSEKDPV